MAALTGYRVLEFAGIGPGPFCAMMLADMGAEVIRIDRVSGSARKISVDPTLDVTARGRQSIALDLKKPEAIAAALRLCTKADVLIEGLRPGVMERLGLGPDIVHQHNPRLVYGRMTGWGQTGPLAQTAGHDINYLAISGSLYLFGRSDERPSPPLNVVADMGGGAMMLAYGITCALLERERTGKGPVIDASMTEGAALLATLIYGQKAMGWWQFERGANLLDSGAHFYEVYATKDDRYIAVGAIEPQFYELLLRGLGLDPAAMPAQMDRLHWPALKQRFAEIFRRRTRDEWAAAFARSDACVSPVLTPDEAAQHPQALQRGSFMTACGVAHPAPVPRMGAGATVVLAPPPQTGEHTLQVLRASGFSAAEIDQLQMSGAIHQFDKSRSES